MLRHDAPHFEPFSNRWLESVHSTTVPAGARTLCVALLQSDITCVSNEEEQHTRVTRCTCKSGSYFNIAIMSRRAMYRNSIQWLLTQIWICGACEGNQDSVKAASQEALNICQKLALAGLNQHKPKCVGTGTVASPCKISKPFQNGNKTCTVITQLHLMFDKSIQLAGGAGEGLVPDG